MLDARSLLFLALWSYRNTENDFQRSRAVGIAVPSQSGITRPLAIRQRSPGLCTVAPKHFTALKHDARFLRQVESAGPSDDTLAPAIKHLHDRCNELRNC